QRIADAQVEAGFERRRAPLVATDASRALARRSQAVYAELGLKRPVDESGNGGGTDAAFAAASGKPAVAESFGFAGFGYHSSEEEYVELDSIEPRLYLMTRLIIDASRSLRVPMRAEGAGPPNHYPSLRLHCGVI